MRGIKIAFFGQWRGKKGVRPSNLFGRFFTFVFVDVFSSCNEKDYQLLSFHRSPHLFGCLMSISLDIIKIVQEILNCHK